MKRMLTVGVLAALIALPLAVYAQGGPGRGRGGPGRGGPFAGLDLSADQKQQLKTLREQHQAKVAPLRAQMDVKQAEMRVLWLADQPDRNALLAKAREIDQLRSQLQAERINFQLAALSLLTPEQRTQVKARFADGPKRDGGGPGGGGFGGPAD